MLQQPLRKEIFKIFGKGGEPYMGTEHFMGGLDKPLETIINLQCLKLWNLKIQENCKNLNITRMKHYFSLK